MFYPETAIDELMPDALVHTLEPSTKATFINSIGYFTKSRPKIISTEVEKSTTFITPESDKTLKTKQVWELYEGSHGTLPESVLCHPSIGYSTRYGNVILNGLDNAIGYIPTNNGSWKP
jgi:hypothetical protein